MFFRFCLDREWIANNPAAKLKVKVQVKEKDPFVSEEWRRIKDAVSIYQDGHGRLGQANAQELMAFVLVLRHSGLSISDAVKLERSQLVPSSNGDGFGLSVFQQKVQRTVYIPLPDGRHETDDVVGALRALPAKSERYFFGPVTVVWIQPRRTGGRVLLDSSNWQNQAPALESRLLTNPILTASGIHLPPGISWPGCP